ncbi:hypothetical protein N8I77_007307 [Diaporthe amygdali]|uniref:Protein kinase domain-containing protein n=1 Tax=Phomopsis amygdali TaxID=1214568 RepID=A0AAD9SCL2_PHOAM|nr:hypothetical protein N8I77_007307 [Diaporthe amygdali]
MGYAIGIDIGTANTRVAVFRDGRVEVIPDKDGRYSMPSYVAFTERCRLFGSAAKAQAASNPESTVYGVKRVLGQRLEQWQVDRYARISPNEVSLKTPEQMTISVSYKKLPHRLSPVQVLGMLVARARANAEAYLGEPVKNAVISVPAHFDSGQRRDVCDAALLAGVNILHLGTSIESIAQYYAFTTQREDLNEDENSCVFLDFGAGFCNVGLAVIEDDIVELIQCASDMSLGGEDLIDRIHDHFAAEIWRKWGWDINTDVRARRRLRVACEAAMRELSSITSAQIYIDSLYGSQDFAGHLSREKLEELCQDLFHATITLVDHVLYKTRWDNCSVKNIVIVGGCSRIPRLQKVWSNYFNSKPLVKVVNPDEGEVLGSACKAAILSGLMCAPDTLVLATVPFNVGVKTKEGIMRTLIHRNQQCPVKYSRKFQLSDFDLKPHERPILQFYQGNRQRARDNLLIGTLDLSELLPSWNDNDCKTKIEIITEHDHRHQVTASAVLEGNPSTLTAWQTMVPRNHEVLRSLIAQARSYKEDDAMEDTIVAERCALDLRLASLAEFQSPAVQTKRMASLLESLGLLRNWLDELEYGSLADYRSCHRSLDDLERDLKIEELREREITGLRSHADELRARLLATTQTPKIGSLLQSVDSVTQWVEHNEQAEIQEYQNRLRSLMAVSVELITLSEAPPSRESTPSIRSPQHPETGPRAQANGLRSFDELFPESGWDTKSKFTDAEFEGIASYLRNTGHQSWSKVPRIYSVLRLIDQVELVEAFLQRDMTDIWFPFSDNTLPKALKQPYRTQFLHAQEAVFSKALELERGTRLDDKKLHRRHAHFSHGEPLPFTVTAVLGSGAHGFVDKVVSTLSYREYARKRFKRTAINKKDVRTFLNEVKILKTLNNRHCIDMVGSYSDPRYFALIISPVAECNLDKYYSLALADMDKRSILQGFFGCLAGTLDYLHSQKVVHQDIKPQNILVKDNSHVLVTDFGIARSWEGLGRATTTADLDRTWLYAAPEVARGGPKNETADVWSLGCVFLEMCTVLKGRSPAEMRAFFKDHSDSTCFHDNAAAGHVASWVKSLREHPDSEPNPALEWVEDMLLVEPLHRCRPFELFDRTVVTSERTGVLFCGACCRDRGESAPESNDEHLDRWSEGDEDT